jgi:hypothetical protein
MDYNSILKIIESVSSVKEDIKPARPKRCQHEGCKVKLMLADFACRCSGFYCSFHRFSEAHMCAFDYKSQGLETLSKQMQAVTGKKIEKL